jgi:4-amino-4-deoxy-L-arabinose transferase-like glycosyltransferase
MKFRELLLLGIILAVGIFFRFFNLSNVPPQATVDEVSIGYNAYSILKTGADEYGTKLPILLRAYDDWRPALYVYLVIPFVALFDLSVFAVRFPSVILSVLSVVSTYFLLRELFRASKLKFEIRNSKFEIPAVATLLLAISPWHIYISRLGHEVNAAHAFFILGLLFFFRFLNRGKWNLYLSALFLALSFDSYQSTKIVVPLVLLVLVILFFKKLIADKKTLFISIIIGFVVSLPIILTSFDDNALIRFEGTNLLTTSQDYFAIEKARFDEDLAQGNLIGLFFDNSKAAAGRLIAHAYLSHLNPVWLFINEGGEQFKAPTMGLLYLFELPLMFLGFLFVRNSGLSGKIIIFLIAWGLIAIIPGGITSGYAHPMRVFNILPLPQIFAAIGFLVFINSLRKYRSAILVGSAFTVFIFAVWFFHSYYTLVPRELSRHFQYGVLEALDQAAKIENRYDRVVVSNRDRLFQSYMFYLYLHKVDPASYQAKGGTISGGFAEEHKIGKYEFGSIEGKTYPNTLYILNPDELRPGMTKLKEIPYPDGKISLILAETPKQQ